MRKITWLIALAIPATMISCQKEAVNKTTSSSRDAEVVIAGNGAPNSSIGGHYNLNIIGMEKGKSIDSAQGNGHRIFVPLWGPCKILLREGDFGVLDPNGTDGSAAFRLPAPDPDSTGTTAYSVYVRGLGKPNGKASMVSCGLMEDGDDADNLPDEYCSTSQVVNIDAHGNDNKFTNVSKQLLYVWANIDDDADLEITPLFDDEFYEYYWKYENQGLRLAQMRFYPGVHTTVFTR